MRAPLPEPTLYPASSHDPFNMSCYSSDQNPPRVPHFLGVKAKVSGFSTNLHGQVPISALTSSPITLHLVLLQPHQSPCCSTTPLGIRGGWVAQVFEPVRWLAPVLLWPFPWCRMPFAPIYTHGYLPIFYSLLKLPCPWLFKIACNLVIISVNRLPHYNVSSIGTRIFVCFLYCTPVPRREPDME